MDRESYNQGCEWGKKSILIYCYIKAEKKNICWDFLAENVHTSAVTAVKWVIIHSAVKIMEEFLF